VLGCGVLGIKKTGDIVIEPKYDQVGNFLNDQVRGKNSVGSFVIDKKGKILSWIYYRKVRTKL
jgi:hypothetical protein